MSHRESPPEIHPQTAEVQLCLGEPGARIAPELHGHFVEHLGHCIYGGLWVGEDSEIPNTRGLRDSAIGALRRMGVPVLRWPGGCFADDYDWRDGVGPREDRIPILNTHWGGVVESNHFGTHEFMDLCEQLGAQPYVCGNVCTGSVESMKDWVQYLTSDADAHVPNQRRRHGRDRPWALPYFGVGNESWGCGGNMRPEYYADVYRHYATFVKSYGQNRVRRIACGPNGPDYHWTDVLMGAAARHMEGLSLHWYTLPSGNWQQKGSATRFDEGEWYATFEQALRIEELIREHSAIMDRHDPERRVGLVVDEWGVWCDPEPGTNPAFLFQQSSVRDALVAALHLNVFQAHAARVTMANLAQLVNVLQASLLTDGPRLIRTPTYHVLEMYKVHRSATHVPTRVASPHCDHAEAQLPALHTAASRDAEGHVHVSLVNLDARRGLRVAVSPGSLSTDARILSAERITAHNTTEAPFTVSPRKLPEVAASGGALTLELPPRSVVVTRVQ